jgi:methylthioribose-1-phosphate isomerase
LRDEARYEFGHESGRKTYAQHLGRATARPSASSTNGAPHRFATIRLQTLQDVVQAIATMQVRSAPLIGAAAYGVCLALAMTRRTDRRRAYSTTGTRPTAINLKWGSTR